MSGDVDDFNFYLKFAKPIVLNLPDAKDRAIAALWLKKLGEINSQNPENDQHVEYLKLLLLATQKKKLCGIFEKPPPNVLKPFPDQRTVLDMMYLVKSKKVEDSSIPSVYVSVSADLCEFVSVQEIPNFGIQGYYAVSTEPLTKWIRPTTGEPVMHVPCYKDTCKLSKLSSSKEKGTTKKAQSKDPVNVTDVAKGQSKEFMESQNMGSSLAVNVTDELDNSLLPQTFSKMELPFLETRPCWGTNRYIERLIDESPHIMGDLDLSEADAILHLFKDRRMKPAKKGGPCLLSSKRREVERKLDLPPCADDPGDSQSSSEESVGIHSCLPYCDENIDITCTDYCIPDEEKEVVQSTREPCVPKSISSKLWKKQGEKPFPKQPPFFVPKYSPQDHTHGKIDKYKDMDAIDQGKFGDDSDLYYRDWFSDVPDTSTIESTAFPRRTYTEFDSEGTILPGTRLQRDESAVPAESPRERTTIPPPPLTLPPPSMHLRQSQISPVPPPPPPPLPPTPRPVHIPLRHRVRTARSSDREGARDTNLRMSYGRQPFVLPPHVTVRHRTREQEAFDQSPYDQGISKDPYAFTAFVRSTDPEAQVPSLERSRQPSSSWGIGQELPGSRGRGLEPEVTTVPLEQPHHSRSLQEADSRPSERSRFARTLQDSTRSRGPAGQAGFVSLRAADRDRSQFVPDDSYLPLMSREDTQRSSGQNARLRTTDRVFQQRISQQDVDVADSSGFINLPSGEASAVDMTAASSYWHPVPAEGSQTELSPQRRELVYQSSVLSFRGDSFAGSYYNIPASDRDFEEDVGQPDFRETFRESSGLQQSGRAREADRIIAPRTSRYYSDGDDDPNIFLPIAESTVIDN